MIYKIFETMLLILILLNTIFCQDKNIPFQIGATQSQQQSTISPLGFFPFGTPPPTTPKKPRGPDINRYPIGFGYPREAIPDDTKDRPNLFGITGPTKDPRTEVIEGNLTCYVCHLDFRNGYNASHHCLGRRHGNISNIYLTNCNSADIYCKVERTEVNGILISLTRQCIDICYYGCRPKGFGINSESCSDCCDTFGCNSLYPISEATSVNLSVIYIMHLNFLLITFININ